MGAGRRVPWRVQGEPGRDALAGWSHYSLGQVLDVYQRPCNAAFPVVCMDETPRKWIRETRTPVPMGPGQPARHDYKYVRCGTCTVFMATEPLAGVRITRVMDNLNIHCPGVLYEAFEPTQAKALWDRFEFVHAPKHGSWLNVAEVELSVMVRQICLNQRIDCMPVPTREVGA